MARSTLWQLSFTAAPEAADALAHQLEALFQHPVTIYTNLLRRRTTLTVLFQELPAPIPALLARARACILHVRLAGLEPRPGRLSVSRVKPTNWAEAWKHHFPPIRVGSRLLIRPSWSRTRPRRNQAVLTLDPGLSFGTGHHPTTLFCLRCLARLRPGHKPSAFLDIGCGSGILALAAARLGFHPIRAFDFDPESVRAARANACRNNLAHTVRPRRADLRRTRPRRSYDLVAANLMPDLLVAEAKRLANFVTARGHLVLAGILASQFDTVRRVFEGLCFRLIRRRTQRGWTSGLFQKDG